MPTFTPDPDDFSRYHRDALFASQLQRAMKPLIEQAIPGPTATLRLQPTLGQVVAKEFERTAAPSVEVAFHRMFQPYRELRRQELTRFHSNVARIVEGAHFKGQLQRFLKRNLPLLRAEDIFLRVESNIGSRVLESIRGISSAYIRAAGVDADRLQNSMAGLYSSILKNGPYGSMASVVLQDVARFPMKNADIAGLQRSMTNLARIIRRAQASHYLPRDWSGVSLGQSFANMVPDTATWPSAADTTEDLSLPSIEDLIDQIGTLTVALILWVRNGGSVITARKLFEAIIMTYTVYMAVAEGVNTTVEFMENLQHFYELLQDK